MSVYEPDLYHDSELGDDMPDQWTLQDYTLAQALGAPSNYSAEKLLKACLDTDLAERITFDSEMGCFFAHAAERNDLEAVAAVIAELVANGPNPNCEPGGLLASVASPFSDTQDFPSWLTEADDVAYVRVDLGDCTHLDPCCAERRPVCGVCPSNQLEVVEPISPPLEPFVRVLLRCKDCGTINQAVQYQDATWRLPVSTDYPDT